MSDLSVFYIIDLSSSMEDNLDKLNHCIEDCNELLEKYVYANKAALKIAMMTYNDSCDWLTPHGPEENFAFDYFTKTNGVSDLGMVLDELNDKLSDGLFYNQSNNYLPVIIFITNDDITKSNKAEYEKINNNKIWLNAIKINFPLKNTNTQFWISENDIAVIYDKDKCFFINYIKAKLGDSEGLYWLSSLFRDGKFVKQNKKESIKYLKLSADKGNVIAQYELGIMYRDGKDVVKNNDEAFKYIKLSADNGHIEAQFCLGGLYCDGIGIEQNNREAFKYFKLSADNGNDLAQYCIGIMFKNGIGVNQSVDEAFMYFRLSADNGNADSQYQLAHMYYKGISVPQDYKEARKYFELSAKQGKKDAILDLRNFDIHHRI